MPPPRSSLRDDLLAAVRFARSPRAGNARLAVGRGVEATPGEQVDELAMLLYTYWYTRSGNPHRRSPLIEPPTLVARLRAAHAATARFDSDWHVVAAHGRGAIIAARSGEQISLVPPDYVNLTHLAVPARVGDVVAVSRRRDHVDHENGWWMTDGSAGAAPVSPMIRLYWHCPAPSAAALVAGITDVLERNCLPYSLKCPVEASLFGRTDAMVLYFAPEVFETCKLELRDVHESVAMLLDESVPPLTLRLGRGVAAGEDPADGQSYGQSRCAAVAEALVQAQREQVIDEADVVDAIIAGLPAHGISGSRPFLGVDSPADLVTPW